MRPKVGQVIVLPWGNLRCRIYRVYPYGAVDVEALDGSERCFRVSGLAFS